MINPIVNIQSRLPDSHVMADAETFPGWILVQSPQGIGELNSPAGSPTTRVRKHNYLVVGHL